MIKKLILAIVGLSLSLTTLTACNNGSGNSGYFDYCVNPYTYVRVPDAYCVGHPAWLYYVPSGSYVPAYGGRVSGYNVHNRTLPKGVSLNKNYHAPSKGVSLTKTSTNTKTGFGSRVRSTIRSHFSRK